VKIFSWVVLLLLLGATLVGALRFDRRSWPSLVGDEATYMMAAQSLAWDHDLRYEKADYRRFLDEWHVAPEGLILQSPDGGKTLVYGKPAAYPAFVAPFLRLSPRRGPWIANAVLLIAAALATALALRRRLGPATPLWVAAWIFASVSFAYVFWAHADLFLACVSALGFALVYGGDEEPGRHLAWRWLGAGLLLGIVVLSRPLYAPLLLPAVLAAPPPLRKRAALWLGAGMLLLALPACAVNLFTRGSWSSYGGQRRSYYGYTGFPLVQAKANDWQEEVSQRGQHGWLKSETLEAGFDARQTAWNAVYYLAGRHVGVLPYFLPLLLGLLAFVPGQGRWALPLAALLAAALLFWVRPFNFWGGGGSIANRYFLPAYPAFWFMAARSLRGWRSVAPPVLVTALAAPFLWPLWVAPRDFPVGKDGGYRWVSPQAQEWLPYETTQSHLKPSGQEDVLHDELWVKMLSPRLHAVHDGEALSIDAGPPAEVLVGCPEPLRAIRVLTSEGSVLSVPGGLPAYAPDEVGWRVKFDHPRAVHRMWWTDQPTYLYVVRLVPAPEGKPVRFYLYGVRSRESEARRSRAEQARRGH